MAECYNKIILKEKNIEVPCGKCLNCLNNKKKEKALRFIQEMNNYKFKLFITLTMDEVRATRSKSGRTTIDKDMFKKYIMKLQYWEKKYNMKITKNDSMKYISCGEYGERTQRAHYHIVLLTNAFIHHKIKTCWQLGHVEMEAVRDVRAIYYTAGYTDKKVKTYFKDKYKKDLDDREIAFLKVSRGNGKKYIEKKVAEIKPDKYYIESFNGKNSIPTYYKTKLKEYIMGVKPQYIKLSEIERPLYENRKTFMVNHKEYYKEYYKWDNFISKVKEERRKNEPIMYRNELYNKYKDKWADVLYRLLYDESYYEKDEKERFLINYYKSKREKLKIEAEQKWFRTKKERDIA